MGPLFACEKSGAHHMHHCFVDDVFSSSLINTLPIHQTNQAYLKQKENTHPLFLLRLLFLGDSSSRYGFIVMLILNFVSCGGGVCLMIVCLLYTLQNI